MTEFITTGSSATLGSSTPFTKSALPISALMQGHTAMLAGRSFLMN